MIKKSLLNNCSIVEDILKHKIHTQIETQKIYQNNLAYDEQFYYPYKKFLICHSKLETRSSSRALQREV